MGHLSDLKRSGHWPSLLAAFLHFDTSFVVWVILGALAPFIAADALISGPNLRVTPLPVVTAGRYSLVITGPRRAAHEAASVYHLLVKPVGPGASGATLEAYTLN